MTPVKRAYLPATEWSACTLSGVMPLGDSGCTKYSFTLGDKAQVTTPASRLDAFGSEPSRTPACDPAQTFGLQLGETLSLMALDEDGKIRKSEMIPSSPREATGGFDLVVRDCAELAVSCCLPCLRLSLLNAVAHGCIGG